MKHTKRAKASNGKALDGEELVDWVQCPSCERWLERSDTPFETTQEAEADLSFLCRICERMRVMREPSQLQWKQESESWQLALDSLAARLEAHIVNSINEREVLLDKLAEERRLRGALLEQVGALQRALDITADKTSSHENTSATRRVEVTKSEEDVSNPTNGQSTEEAEALPAQDVKKKSTRHRRSRKKNEDIHVGFLNLHGARTASKWEELYQMMGDEDIEIYAVAETHLRVMEEPPVHKSWQWAGLNRSGQSRKGGGLGFLWKTRSAWKKLDSPCGEHMWVEGYLQGLAVLVGVAYFAVSAGADAGNSRMAQCIREDVARWANQREVLIMGGFNGHLQALDDFQDTNGELLLALARTLALDVLNLRPECEGQYTWSARNSRSCIDYVLATPASARRLTHMNIDEKALRTQVYRRHFDPSLADSTVQCRTCGKDEENIEQLVLHRECLCPRQTDGATLPEALAFVNDCGTPGGDSRDTNVHPLAATAITKARLLQWWSRRQ
ncbi:hypothetical protein HPB51_003949 [Rhipicephalus microplus]|uniref:Endonuclease/exonuclease/phosphatase domain-containing protein n=1 Tax=Rhipicephalus microplus TaxID=6941 RepID=A0A9J6EQN2_RHIMP|nr:hypothetical protein HPB51_003949 [Rhipicephalus microplus]